jgi:heterodisulfide reductase subunit B2
MDHFEEIDDWNCCGATEYLGINLIPAYSLIARNLALATKQMNPGNGTGGTRTVVAPCSACYLNLAKADYYMQERPSLGVKVNEALAAGGLQYKPGTLDVRHLLDILVYDVGLDTIKSKVVRPLTGTARCALPGLHAAATRLPATAGLTMNTPQSWMTCCAPWARM